MGQIITDCGGCLSVWGWQGSSRRPLMHAEQTSTLCQHDGFAVRASSQRTAAIISRASRKPGSAASSAALRFGAGCDEPYPDAACVIRLRLPPDLAAAAAAVSL